jgi:hypothetical protein
MQLVTQTSLPVLLAACLVASVAIMANMICFTMIGKINERLPESERVSYFWWGTQVRTKFKRLYPTSRLVLLLDSCVVMMIFCFIFLVRFWVFR